MVSFELFFLHVGQTFFQFILDIFFHVFRFQKPGFFAEGHDPAFEVAVAGRCHGQDDGAVGVVSDVLVRGPGFFLDVSGFIFAEKDFYLDRLAMGQVKGGVQGFFRVKIRGIVHIAIQGADAMDALAGIASDCMGLQLLGKQVEAAPVFVKMQGADVFVLDFILVKRMIGDFACLAVQHGFREAPDDVFFFAIGFGAHGFADENPLQG